jgi:hypothetical protein
MNQLSLDAFLFAGFWGCLFLVTAGVVVTVWDWVVERRVRSRVWARLGARTWVQREWSDDQ